MVATNFTKTALDTMLAAAAAVAAPANLAQQRAVLYVAQLLYLIELREGMLARHAVAPQEYEQRVNELTGHILFYWETITRLLNRQLLNPSSNSQSDLISPPQPDVPAWVDHEFNFAQQRYEFYLENVNEIVALFKDLSDFYVEQAPSQGGFAAQLAQQVAQAAETNPRLGDFKKFCAKQQRFLQSLMLQAVTAKQNSLLSAPWVITLTGTNGKGSVGKILSENLIACGFKVVRTQSPHLHQYNERVLAQGVPVSDGELLALFLTIDRARFIAECLGIVGEYERQLSAYILQQELAARQQTKPKKAPKSNLDKAKLGNVAKPETPAKSGQKAKAGKEAAKPQAAKPQAAKPQTNNKKSAKAKTALADESALTTQAPAGKSSRPTQGHKASDAFVQAIAEVVARVAEPTSTESKSAEKSAEKSAAKSSATKSTKAQSKSKPTETNSAEAKATKVKATATNAAEAKSTTKQTKAPKTKTTKPQAPAANQASVETIALEIQHGLKGLAALGDKAANGFDFSSWLVEDELDRIEAEAYQLAQAKIPQNLDTASLLCQPHYQTSEPCLLLEQSTPQAVIETTDSELEVDDSLVFHRQNASLADLEPVRVPEAPFAKPSEIRHDDASNLLPVAAEAAELFARYQAEFEQAWYQELEAQAKQVQAATVPAGQTVSGANSESANQEYANQEFGKVNFANPDFAKEVCERFGQRIRKLHLTSVRNQAELTSSSVLWPKYDHLLAKTTGWPLNQQPLGFYSLGALAGILSSYYHQADFFVQETGIGGRLDTVNLLDAHTLVVTGIDKDHSDWLGDEPASILGEKLHLLRPTTTLVANLEPSLEPQAKNLVTKLHGYYLPASIATARYPDLSTYKVSLVDLDPSNPEAPAKKLEYPLLPFDQQGFTQLTTGLLSRFSPAIAQNNLTAILTKFVLAQFNVGAQACSRAFTAVHTYDAKLQNHSLAAPWEFGNMVFDILCKQQRYYPAVAGYQQVNSYFHSLAVLSQRAELLAARLTPTVQAHLNFNRWLHSYGVSGLALSPFVHEEVFGRNNYIAAAYRQRPVQGILDYSRGNVDGEGNLLNYALELQEGLKSKPGYLPLSINLDVAHNQQSLANLWQRLGEAEQVQNQVFAQIPSHDNVILFAIAKRDDLDQIGKQLVSFLQAHTSYRLVVLEAPGTRKPQAAAETFAQLFSAQDLSQLGTRVSLVAQTPQAYLADLLESALALSADYAQAIADYQASAGQKRRRHEDAHSLFLQALAKQEGREHSPALQAGTGLPLGHIVITGSFFAVGQALGMLKDESEAFTRLGYNLFLS